MSTSREQIEQIRRAHRYAKPTKDNPAWFNTHRDLGLVLDYLEHQEEQGLRDELAGRAMQTLLLDEDGTNRKAIATVAYRMADEMLSARKEEKFQGV